MTSLRIGIFLLLSLSLGWALPSYRYRLPNGHRVACPDGAEGCRTGDSSHGEPASVCSGLGHANCAGGSLPANPFGADFAAEGFQWTTALCQKDSDGDGQSNGDELGDPCCRWGAGDAPSPYMASFSATHPGMSTSLQVDSWVDGCVGQWLVGA